MKGKKLVNKLIETEAIGIDRILSARGQIYTFLNPVSYLDAQKRRDLLEQFNGIWADGSLLVSAIRLLYGCKITRRSFDMTSLVPILFDYAERNGKTLYFVASQSDEIEKAVERFRKSYPRLQIIGYRNGYFKGEEIKHEIQHITQLNPDFLIVGMGAILQETFLLNVRNAGYSGIGFTCGGFIHQTAMNNMNYYPEWVNRMNIRFIYRMIMEKHTRKRYLKAAVVFPCRFIFEKFFG